MANGRRRRALVIEEIKATARELIAPQIAAVVAQTGQMFFQAIFDGRSR